MNIKEARAQWTIGNNYRTGRNVEKDQDKATEWYLKAWDNGFPGTATTQTFVLYGQWQSFVRSSYADKPRMINLLSDAMASAGEREGEIVIFARNNAQADWVIQRLEEIQEAFTAYTQGRFAKITIKISL